MKEQEDEIEEASRVMSKINETNMSESKSDISKSNFTLKSNTTVIEAVPEVMFQNEKKKKMVDIIYKQ